MASSGQIARVKMADDSSPNTAVVVTGGAIGGALATVLTWAFKTFFKMDLEPNVAAAMSVLLIALGGWIGAKFGKR
jgi:ABC-type sugar transport system permease subunit